MRILTRYVLREYLVPLGYCLSGFISIYVLFELFGSFSRLAEADLPPSMVAEYFCAYLAPYFEWLAPAALMLAALYTMWSFCRHSELIAMRANGLGFFTIVKPILFVAALMAAAVWWVNDCYVPRRAQWAASLKSERFRLADMEREDNVVFRNARADRTWTVGSLADDDARRLEDVRVTVDRPDGSRLMTVTAPRAEYLDGEWWFSEPAVQHYDTRGDEVATPTPELDALPLRSFPAFGEKPSDFLSQNRRWEYNSIADRFRYIRTHPEMTEDARAKCVYDTWAKILAPFACIIITLFAIPAGVATGRQSVFKGILGALALFFSFYGVVIACMVAADSKWLPPLVAAFLPYVLFLVLGLRAFAKQR
ncbi:MAG: LptF/LptG family permease [Kiritimatiellae bacterium]|nr:LptF/LptG family permease [Kiritimatiellia bacterium]